jgi:NAD(P)-dependent dehydrogenase (short-subunit alcohol dehydrogenase family)
MSEVTVVIGAGSIGQAIARRVSAGKHVLFADLRQGNADAAAEVLGNAGFEVSTATVDVASRQSLHALVETATGLGEVTGVIHAAGVSPSQASPAAILAVDLYGTAVLLEEFGNVIARGGAGIVISSQSGHRLGALTAEQDAALATTPADELLALAMLQPDQVTDSLHAYQLAKRGNSLRVMAEAVRWGKRGARVNTISPGIIFTPLAKDELTGPRGEGYRRMLELSLVGRGGTRTRSRPSAHSSWAPTAPSSPAATCSWTVASPPPTSSATSPHSDRSSRSSSLPCLRWINRTHRWA